MPIPIENGTFTMMFGMGSTMMESRSLVRRDKRSGTQNPDGHDEPFQTRNHFSYSLRGNRVQNVDEHRLNDVLSVNTCLNSISALVEAGCGLYPTWQARLWRFILVDKA